VDEWIEIQGSCDMMYDMLPHLNLARVGNVRSHAQVDEGPALVDRGLGIVRHLVTNQVHLNQTFH
jgi:hypothetical protein